ncbi:hypothetical protein SEA_GUANICA15_100 [Mycobacterium phage Guanica15]|nr:hypothetical protein SEA_GUANICA15_100 [Mycobacterium phage Guanica15]
MACVTFRLRSATAQLYPTALAPRNGALGPFPFQALIRAARPPIPARRSASRPSP